MRSLGIWMLLLCLAACGGQDAPGDVTGDAWSPADVPGSPPGQDVQDPPEEEGPLPVGGTTKRLLTRRGAHSYLLFPAPDADDGTATAGPVLYWRQYSDLASHLGVFSPLVKPLVHFRTGVDCQLESYSWEASHVVRFYTCGSLKVIETTAYVAQTTIAVRYRVQNEGADAALSIEGAPASAGISAAVTKDAESAQVRVHLDGEYLSTTGSAPAAWRFTGAVTPAPASFDVHAEDQSWSFNYAVPAAELVDIVIAFELAEGEEPTVTPLEAGDLYGPINETVAELKEWFGQVPDTTRLGVDGYANAWYLFWENAAAPLDNWFAEALPPSKRHYFRSVRLWDSALQALALAHGGDKAIALARKQVELFTKAAGADGHLPRAIWTGDVDESPHPPGMLTWASLRIADRVDETRGEALGIGMLAADYEVLKANHEWFYAQRDSDGDGLCEWDGPDSGWDGSPRWDQGPVEALDLACWLYLDARLLATMATRQARLDDADAWNTEAEELAARIQTEFWDADDECFYDLSIADNQPVRVKTPVTFLPLFVGAASQPQAQALAAHLADPAVFATPWLLPSVAASDPAYKSGNYWRGPVWIALNAFAIWGLERYGLADASQALKTQTCALFEDNETAFEYYDSQTGKGLGARDFAPSAAVYLLLQGDSPNLW